MLLVQNCHAISLFSIFYRVLHDDLDLAHTLEIIIKFEGSQGFKLIDGDLTSAPINSATITTNTDHDLGMLKA